MNVKRLLRTYLSLQFLRAKKNLTGFKKPVRFQEIRFFEKIGFLKALKFLTII